MRAGALVTFFGNSKMGGDTYNKRPNADGFIWHANSVYHVR